MSRGFAFGSDSTVERAHRYARLPKEDLAREPFFFFFFFFSFVFSYSFTSLGSRKLQSRAKLWELLDKECLFFGGGVQWGADQCAKAFLPPPSGLELLFWHGLRGGKTRVLYADCRLPTAPDFTLTQPSTK